MSQLTKVFAVNRNGFSPTGGVAIGGVLLVIWFTSFSSSAEVSGHHRVRRADDRPQRPWRWFWNRARAMGVFGLVGAR